MRALPAPLWRSQTQILWRLAGELGFGMISRRSIIKSDKLSGGNHQLLKTEKPLKKAENSYYFRNYHIFKLIKQIITYLLKINKTLQKHIKAQNLQIY